MHSLAVDLRCGLRSLLRTPGFSAVTALVLALGIGANTAIFSVVHAVLLRPLAFDEPERLVSVWEISPDDAGRMHEGRATAGNYFDGWKQNTVFDGLLIGMAGALALGRVMSSLLFGVSATEPTIFAVVACFLVVVAGVASYLPARKASSIGLLAALRHE